MIHTRLGCSTISFRHLDLDAALATIGGTRASPRSTSARCPGCATTFRTCSTRERSTRSPAPCAASGLRVRSINGDIGDLNEPLDRRSRTARDRHLDALLALAVATGSRALVLPCGALDHTPVAR